MEVRKSPRKTTKTHKLKHTSIVDLDDADGLESPPEFVVKSEREGSETTGSGKKKNKKKTKTSTTTPPKKKKKVLTFEFDDEDEEEDVKVSGSQRMRRVSGDESQSHEVEEDEEEVPISRLKKKRKWSSEFDGEGGLGFEDEMVKDEDGADLGDGGLHEDDMMSTQLSQFQTQETEDGDALEAQERRVKPRAASTLPIVFGEKVNRTKVLMECEGEAVDLSGDMGAVGRFTVDRDNELSLDLKGIIYKTTIVPSNTFFVVNVGQTEAKVECIMSDFVQLRADANSNENETMVEGTLKDFGFDSDEEREQLAVDGAEKADTSKKTKDEEGADDEEKPKKKEKAAKAPKTGKAPSKKAAPAKSKVRVASAKGVGKKPKATKPKATKPKASKK